MNERSGNCWTTVTIVTGILFSWSASQRSPSADVRIFPNPGTGASQHTKPHPSPESPLSPLYRASLLAPVCLLLCTSQRSLQAAPGCHALHICRLFTKVQATPSLHQATRASRTVRTTLSANARFRPFAPCLQGGSTTNPRYLSLCASGLFHSRRGPWYTFPQPECPRRPQLSISRRTQLAHLQEGPIPCLPSTSTPTPPPDVATKCGAHATPPLQQCTHASIWCNAPRSPCTTSPPLSHPCCS